MKISCLGCCIVQFCDWVGPHLMVTLLKVLTVCGIEESDAGVNNKPQKFIFEYWVFSQKSYLNMWCFVKSIFAYLKFNICIPKLGNLHTIRQTLILSVGVT